MTDNTSDVMSWSFHFVFFLFIALAFVHAARERSGSILKWPVGLRWIFSGLFFLLSAVSVNMIVERYTGGSKFGAIIQWLPIPLEIWVLYRMMTKGLSLDKWEKENG